MFRSITFQLVVLPIVLAQSFVSATAQQARPDNQPQAFRQIHAGDAPTLNVEDFRGYAVSNNGSATISGRVVVNLNSGESVECRDADLVNLYPDTPFTRWMIARWALDSNEKPFIVAPVADKKIKIPRWLDEQNSILEADDVVRHAACYDRGRFVFHGVPPGNYFAQVTILRFAGPISSGPSGNLVQTDTPNGPQTSVIGSTVGGGRLPSDWYIVVSKFPVIIRGSEPSRFVFREGDFAVVSHALPDN